MLISFRFVFYRSLASQLASSIVERVHRAQELESMTSSLIEKENLWSSSNCDKRTVRDGKWQFSYPGTVEPRRVLKDLT
jgi:hypothetical protein